MGRPLYVQLLQLQHEGIFQCTVKDFGLEKDGSLRAETFLNSSVIRIFLEQIQGPLRGPCESNVRYGKFGLGPCERGLREAQIEHACMLC